jgi:hypothetical protein
MIHQQRRCMTASGHNQPSPPLDVTAGSPQKAVVEAVGLGGRVGAHPDSCTAQQAPVLKSVADCFCKFSMPSTVNAARKRYL